MRTIQGVRAGWLVGALGACILVAGAARADVATERPGSILIFPKVVRDGTRDTIIQITNTGNLTNQVRCFYLDGELGRNGAAVCRETDFDLTLTRQQPTHWSVTEGRKVDLSDPFGSDGAGLDPGLIPAAPLGFTGALVCAEVQDGHPFAQNKLKGEATLIAANGIDESKYNAIAVPGLNVGTADNDLSLDNAEYGACPSGGYLNFIANGANDPVIEANGNGGTCDGASVNPGQGCNSDLQCPGGLCITGQSRVDTVLTLLPCDLDFQTGSAGSVTVQFVRSDEFEVTLSGSKTISCWGSFNIGTIGALRSGTDPLNPGGSISTQYATTTLSFSRPAVGIAETFHTDAVGNTASSANNLHVIPGSASALIRLTDE